MKKLFAFLFSPSAKLSVALLVCVGIVIGVAGLVTINFVWKETSTQEFCTSCHEHDGTQEWWAQSPHGNTSHGVVADCSSCHVPHDFFGKTLRKIEAAKEVYGAFTGVIDTPEKYMAHKESMDERERKRFRSNDSANCRYCHQMDKANLELQSRGARRMHGKYLEGKYDGTCIDCHEGIGHEPPPDYGKAETETEAE